MILSDRGIRKAVERVVGEEPPIRIFPYAVSQVQPASYDVRLGSEFRIFESTDQAFVDPLNLKDPTKKVKIRGNRPFVLHPHEFALGRTLETIGLSDRVSAQLNGKSSLGRLGLVIHSTAGWVDPGFEGSLTLELSNDANLPILLTPGMLIGQLTFGLLDEPAEHPYDGRFQGQRSPEVQG